MLRELYRVGQKRQVGLDLTGQTEVYALFTPFFRAYFAANLTFSERSSVKAIFFSPEAKTRNISAIGREDCSTPSMEGVELHDHV
jgi:hypothetical protein